MGQYGMDAPRASPGTGKRARVMEVGSSQQLVLYQGPQVYLHVCLSSDRTGFRHLIES